MLTRALTPNKAKLDGVGVIKPHVWKTRVGLLDMDLNVHLNNASYLYNMELARWHLSGLNGMLHHCFSKRWMLLVGSQSIRYRHSIAPFQAYEIHSDIVHWDDQWFYFIHRFVCPTTGKLFAEGLTRGMVKDSNRQTIKFIDVTKQLGLGTPASKPMPDVVKTFLEWDAATKASTAAWNPADHIDDKRPKFLQGVNFIK
ncbi:hypothetical protein H310_03850 [Aphanomyces invadans]|uniref:Thioesterase n=1 Tax=Aphanomyces invadans TaxID=157072 RepID=A0A024UE47_9STRA|nr:hypothetical protein H310_03850 [Aphanomyces invadans]ETW04691.1 hypothetical protein H310_03850 [Aphanomyces invadans]|eukprot:XP_008866129.1 hypothetical protein H310_03850 [Aphanomyces invadans]